MVTDQEVSDKEILAVRGQLGAYAGDNFDVQFAFDWMDDQSGVRGAQMLAPNRFVPSAPPMITSLRTIASMGDDDLTVEVTGGTETVTEQRPRSPAARGLSVIGPASVPWSRWPRRRRCSCR